MENNATANPNTSSEEEYRSHDHTTAIIPLFTFIIGGFGNVFVIYVCLKSKKLRDNTHLFILNLAITDLITSATSGLYLINVFTNVILTSYYGCIILEQMATLMIFVSQFMIALTTFERYIAICHRERYLSIMTKRKKGTMIVLAWTISFMLSLIQLLENNNWDRFHMCIYETLYPDYMYVTFSTFILTLMLTVLILYARILKVARDFHRKICPANTNAPHLDTQKIRKKKQAIRNGKTMGIVTMVFLCCWLPWHVCQYFFGTKISQTVLDISMYTCALGVSNSVVDPFIYAWQKKTFRNEARRLCCCLKKKLKINFT